MERARRDREVGVSRSCGTNWSRGYKTYRNGVVVGFVEPLDCLAVREVSERSTRTVRRSPPIASSGRPASRATSWRWRPRTSTRAGELIGTTDWRTALDFLTGARTRIEHRLDDEVGRAMYGQLHLKSGLAAARLGDAATVDDHVREARECAAHVGEFRDDYDLSFNRHSVDIWAVGLAVELMDGTKAVKLASTMADPRGISTERVGHHYIDLARGFLLHGDKSRAFESLLTARDIAPQQTRYHPQVVETARLLAQSERRRSDSLANFVGWLAPTP